MKEIPQEQRLERYDTVPQSLRDALNSEVIDELLQTIGEVHHLGEERTFKMVKIYGLIVLGFIHPQDLQREIASELNIDKRLVDEIAHELQIKILNPLLPEVNAAFNYHITGIPAPSATPPFSPSQPEIVRPSFAPPEGVANSKEQVVSERPFILHEERADVNQVRPTEETLMRPDFYEEPRGGQEERTPQRPMVARLEIGSSTSSGQVKEEEPRAEKTEAPEIRVVHYSPLQTPVDPFGNQTPEVNNQMPENDTQNPEPPKDIHPQNIVDLKDLPR